MIHAEVRPERVRVRLFPQSPAGGGLVRLETVTLSSRRGTVGPGPTDARIRTIDAPTKLPYGLDATAPGGLSLPPWRGPVLPAALPSPAGHFDHLRPGDPGFRAVHLYGCVRFALDVWEHHIGGPIPWHFARHYPRLELVALRGWANAHMGYGYLEAGERRLAGGRTADLCLDFDVVAHEVGHALMMSLGGPFSPSQVSPEYEALHETSADWASIIAVLHLDAMVEEVMETTRGDLDSFNRLNRFAEFSSSRQIRLANNTTTMWDFAYGFRNEHDLSQPLLAALWDGFVDIYNELLVMRGAISRALERLAERAEHDTSLRLHVAREYRKSFARRPGPFYDALAETREIAAIFLLGLWRRIDPATFTFADIPQMLREIDRAHFGGALRHHVQGNLAHRGIGVIPPGPRLRAPGKSSHVHSERTAEPEMD
jgi:hypothetical protein